MCDWTCPYYSEKNMLQLLKGAPIEKLMEYLLMKTRRT